MASDIRARIESANREFMTAFKRGDAAAIADLYTQEAQLLPFWQRVIEMGLKDASLETLELETHNDTAIEVGRYRLLADGGATADSRRQARGRTAPRSSSPPGSSPSSAPA